MRKAYFRPMPWDYIASSREGRELERLINLREAIAQSKKEFEAGEKILLEDKFLTALNITPNNDDSLGVHFTKGIPGTG